jgi:hypothetical protein
VSPSIFESLANGLMVQINVRHPATHYSVSDPYVLRPCRVSGFLPVLLLAALDVGIVVAPIHRPLYPYATTATGDWSSSVVTRSDPGT